MSSHSGKQSFTIYFIAILTIGFGIRVIPRITATQTAANVPVFTAPETHNFNSPSQGIALSDAPKISGGLTIDAWINPTSLPAGEGLAAVATKWNESANGNSYGLWLENNAGILRIVAAINPTSGAEERVIGGNIPLNAWTHVAMSYDAASSRLLIYQNGNSVGATLGRPSAIKSTNSNLYLGRAQAGAGQSFMGAIAGVEIFDHALTNADVAALATRPTPSITATATPTPTPTPTPHLELNGQGTINGPNGGQASFIISDIEMDMVTQKYFEGKLNFNDSASGVRFASQRITSVSINPDRMSATFSGMSNDQTTSYTVSVTSNQHPTTGDTFTITTNHGYTASGNLTSGAIGVAINPY